MALPPFRDPIPPGTLDMLVLTTLARRSELHGFEIAEAIERASTDILRVEEGSLYPALQRMLSRAGSPANGAALTRTAARGTTGSQRQGGGNSIVRLKPINASLAQSLAYCRSHDAVSTHLVLRHALAAHTGS